MRSFCLFFRTNFSIFPRKFGQLSKSTPKKIFSSQIKLTATKISNFRNSNSDRRKKNFFFVISFSTPKKKLFFARKKWKNCVFESAGGKELRKSAWKSRDFLHIHQVSSKVARKSTKFPPKRWKLKKKLWVTKKSSKKIDKTDKNGGDSCGCKFWLWMEKSWSRF